MIFSTYEFLLLFLPLACLGFYGLARLGWKLAYLWLVTASLVFYGWWSPEGAGSHTLKYVLIIIGSCVFNFTIGRQLGRSTGRAMRLWLVCGVGANLTALVYFKYLTFVSSAFNGILWRIDQPVTVILPLAVSFFTFLQIAYLVDVSRGDRTNYSFSDYLLFVTYFPHLIAGPLVHHRELIPQFSRRQTVFRWRNIATGLTVLGLGLFKKVVIADELSPLVARIFDFAATGERALTCGEAWLGALAYTFQIYFDFSGYSDMAIGISILFGIRLPLNFDSPYKSLSVIDFWRRWHMTLSRFLRDYLYIPLGGGRCGAFRRYFNLMLTMVLGGLWHGAGFAYLIWGLLHGLYLCINHGWRALRARLGLPMLPKTLAFALTFVAVVHAWIPFRAGNYELASPGNTLKAVETTSAFYQGMWAPKQPGFWPSAKDGRLAKVSSVARPLVLAALVAFLLPSTQRFMARYAPQLDDKRSRQKDTRAKWWHWQPRLAFGTVLLILLFFVVREMERGGEFIYFQF
jgi:alginate O-acetyltransferase complex protein AlgI